MGMLKSPVEAGILHVNAYIMYRHLMVLQKRTRKAKGKDALRRLVFGFRLDKRQIPSFFLFISSLCPHCDNSSNLLLCFEVTWEFLGDFIFIILKIFLNLKRNHAGIRLIS